MSRGGSPHAHVLTVLYCAVLEPVVVTVIKGSNNRSFEQCRDSTGTPFSVPSVYLPYQLVRPKVTNRQFLPYMGI